MADEAGDKTEQASQQKLRKVREQGQVVRSRDVATAIGLMVGLKLTLLLMPLWLADFGPCSASSCRRWMGRRACSTWVRWSSRP
jgi:flagellar biosynthesis protein FlhB